MRNELQLRLSIRLEWLSNDSITKLLGDDVIVSIKCLPCLTKHQAKCVSIGYFKAFSKIIFNFISILSNFPFSNSYPNSVSQKINFTMWRKTFSLTFKIFCNLNLYFFWFLHRNLWRGMKGNFMIFKCDPPFTIPEYGDERERWEKDFN